MTRRVIVYHSSYGCDTGCCGHVFTVEEDGVDVENEWQFAHPYGEEFRKWAEEMVTGLFGADHVADLDWDNCHVTDAC